MKKPWIKAAFLFALLAFPVLQTPSTNDREKPSNPGRRKPTSFAQLKREFANPDMIYAPFMFWFWDEPLDPTKMAEMSRVLCSQGFNPGYAHARRSMVGTPDLPDAEWLGDKWFAAFGAALKEAEAQRHYLGYCDEYWWPSLQANGRVLKAHPELEAVSLRWTIHDVRAGAQLMVPESYFAVAVRRERPLPEPTAAKEQTDARHTPASIRSSTLSIIGRDAAFEWKAPSEGDWRVFAFSKFHHPGCDGGKVNYIDERLAPAFIDIALEPYSRRLANRLGKSVPGDFIDNEGDYGWGLAWSETLERRYRERFGRDIQLWMPLLLDQDVEGLAAKARWEWFDLVSDIYCETFQALTDWHEKRGMYTTAHVWEEGLPPQVSAVADHLKLLRALTMPGQDCLGRKALRVHDFKEIASVAEFESARAATELMGAGGFEGTPWGTFTPSFLKQAANAVIAFGMSHIIPHGVFTTRKLTGNPWPPDWYAENPMFQHLHLWTDFVRRASHINSMGSAKPDVLLYNPMESAWANADATILDAEMWACPENHPGGKRINALEKAYATAIDELTAARVEFLVGDRHYLRQMEVKHGKLRGPFAFGTLVLPPLDILTLETARKIVSFAEAGCLVYALGELPNASADHGSGDPRMKDLMQALRSQPTFTACQDGLRPLLGKGAPGLESPLRFESGAFPMLQHRRRIDGRDFFWLVNNSSEWQCCEILVRGARGAASIWDCETGRIRSVSSTETPEGSRLTLVFRPYEAYWLVFDPEEPARAGPPEMRPDTEAVLILDGPWTVKYDAKIQPEMEFPLIPPAEFAAGVEKSLEDWKAWGLEKFSGLLEYTKTVIVKRAKKGMHLDLGKVCHAAEIWVNGKSCGVRLWGPHVYDVSAALRPGANEIRVRVANLINNSYGEIMESGLFGPVTILTIRGTTGSSTTSS
ncbi:MAG: glycosyl hydrolase [Acidobacteriota bacterium]